MSYCMNQTPKISVIVPVYNAERHLRQCIDSILSQSFSNFELLLVDDGSTDTSGTLCEQYAAKDARVQVLHQKNAGVSAARNCGLDEASGEFFTFVDSDDFLDEGFLQAALEGIERENADVFLSGLQMETYAGGKRTQTDVYRIAATRVYSIKELLDALEQDYPQICICGPCCKLYRAEICRTLRFNRKLNFGEDTDFNLDIFAAAKRVLFSEEVFYHYRREGTASLFGRFHPDTHEVHSLVYGKMYALMRQIGCEEETLRRFGALYFAMSVGQLHEYFRFKPQNSRKQRRMLLKKIAADPLLRGVQRGDVRDAKNRVVLFLLRRKLYTPILLLFEAYYFLRRAHE